jgi:hypothetical protein
MSANGVLAFLDLDGSCKPLHLGQILPMIADSDLAEFMKKDAKLKPLLEIMHEGTVGNHDAIGKIKGKEKEPCDCK